MLYLNTLLHVVSASAAIAALTAIVSTASMFYDITNFQDEIRMDLQEFKVLRCWIMRSFGESPTVVYEFVLGDGR